MEVYGSMIFGCVKHKIFDEVFVIDMQILIIKSWIQIKYKAAWLLYHAVTESYGIL